MIVEPPSTPSGPALFVTQREYPRLALVRTQITESMLILSTSREVGVGQRAAGSTADRDVGNARRDDLSIELDRDGPRCRAIVWRDTVNAIDQGDAAARWLSDFIGANLRLVRFDPMYTRPCNEAYAGDSGAHTAFADGYPVLVIGSASLDDLNDRLRMNRTRVPMNRFRPNLVIDGIEPYDEDHLSSIEIGDGGVSLRFVKPCTRCQITTTDQDTARVADEPLATLARYRMDTNLGGVTFGVNAIVERGAGMTINRGAPVKVDWDF